MTPPLAAPAAPVEAAPVEFGDLAGTPHHVQRAAARAVAHYATDVDDARELIAMLGLDRLRRTSAAA